MARSNSPLPALAAHARPAAAVIGRDSGGPAKLLVLIDKMPVGVNDEVLEERSKGGKAAVVDRDENS